METLVAGERRRGWLGRILQCLRDWGETCRQLKFPSPFKFPSPLQQSSVRQSDPLSKHTDTRLLSHPINPPLRATESRSTPPRPLCRPSISVSGILASSLILLASFRTLPDAHQAQLRNFYILVPLDLLLEIAVGPGQVSGRTVLFLLFRLVR